MYRGKYIKKLSKLILICAVLCFSLVGCGSKIDLVLPQFELLSSETDRSKLFEIFGKDYKYGFNHVGDKDYGFTFDSETYRYEMVQKNGKSISFTFWYNSDAGKLSHGVCSVYADYETDPAIDFEKTDEYSAYIQKYYTELFGEPEVESSEKYKEYTWYTNDGCEIRLEDGKKYTSSYYLKIWWSAPE